MRDILVEVNPRYFRPAEVDLLHGDCSKAEKKLGWKRKVGFSKLISMMVEADMREIPGMSKEEYLMKTEVDMDNI